MTTPVSLTYEERRAWLVMRKLILRRPEVATALLEGLSKEAATRVLLAACDELNTLLEVNRAFSAAAAALTKKEAKDDQPNSNNPTE